MKCFFNKNLVIFDKEIEVFCKMKQLKVETPERKLQLFRGKIRVTIKK